MQRKRSSGGKFTSDSKKGRPSFNRTDKSENRGSGKDSKSPKRYSDKKDDFKPRKSYGDDKKDSRGKDDSKPRRNFVKDDKYGKQDDYKPRKSYSDDKRDSRGKDDFKPRKSYGEDKGDFKPRKTYGEDKGGFKPRKSYGDDKRDSRGKDDFKPRKSYGEDKGDFKPRKTYGEDKGDFKPRKSYGDDKRDSRGKDDFKPRKSYGEDKGDFKPRKSYGEDKGDFKPRKSYGDDKRDFKGKDDFKPRKSFDKDKKFGDKDAVKPRKSYGDDKHDSSGKDDFKPRKSYGEDKGDFKPRKLYGDEKKEFKRKDEYKPRKTSEDSDEGTSKKSTIDFSTRVNKYTGRKPATRKVEEEEESVSFEEMKENKKRFTSEKKKYETLSKKTVLSSKKADDGSTRLNKYLSNAGICSRREADQLIESGVIRVNGKIITELGTKIMPGDKVSYGDQTVKSETLVYLLLNKPKDYITTVDDPDKRRTVMELIKGACKERVYPVGRLDRNTTGLLLFTNDGEMTMKLTHPKNNIKKIYHVVTDQNVSKDDLDKLRNGIELEDGFIMPDDVEFVGEGHNKKDIGIEIHSGKNRVVRRMFEHLGYNVVKLDRVMFAGLTKKDLPRGKWRILSAKEVSFLKIG